MPIIRKNRKKKKTFQSTLITWRWSGSIAVTAL